MAEDVDALVVRLWELRHLETQEQLDEYLAAVTTLEERIADTDVSKLLRVFYDETSNTDLMKELLSLVVSFPPKELADALASAVTVMSGYARMWCELLHLWTLRQREHIHLYASALRRVAPEKQSAALALLAKLAAEYADVAPAVETIKASARAS